MRHGAALCAILALIQVGAVSAQESPHRLELSLQGAYYPIYLDGSGDARRFGASAGLLVRPGKGRMSFEIGASIVRQRYTTSSEAPHLFTGRVLAMGESPLSEGSRARVTYGAGLSLLHIDPQRIDCGDFPVCNEWSHGDMTTVAPTGALGVKLPLAGPFSLQAGGRLYVGLSRWEPDGWPVLWELGLGVSARIP